MYIKDATAHNITKVSSVLPSQISLKSTISFKITNSATYDAILNLSYYIASSRIICGRDQLSFVCTHLWKIFLKDRKKSKKHAPGHLRITSLRHR